jgi:ABC-type bacteriocin/lantibiotic exporter with double-glycine peptidase domain
MMGKNADFGEVVERCNLDDHGRSNLAMLERAARELGLFAQSVHTNVAFLRRLDELALLHLIEPQDHFVLYAGTQGKKFRLVDATCDDAEASVMYLTAGELRRIWDGHTLIVALGTPRIRDASMMGILTLAVPAGLVLGLCLLAAIDLIRPTRFVSVHCYRGQAAGAPGMHVNPS